MFSGDLFLEGVCKCLLSVCFMESLYRCSGQIINHHTFHVLYAEYEAQFNLQTLDIIKGELPNRARVLVLEWASEHRTELMEDWELCAHMQTPKKISPLK